jgi:hypothetical protein
MSKAIAAAFPYKGQKADGMAFSADEQDIRRQLATIPEIRERFFDVLAAYVVAGHPHAARPYLPDPQVSLVASSLRSSMELFVLGHEYGHLLAGHLDDRNTCAAMLPDVDAKEIATSWKQELEADAIGLELMLCAQMKKGWDLALSFWGADFFFGCIDVVERAVGILRDGKEEMSLSPTHPPTALRRKTIRDLLRHSLKNEQSAAAEAAIQLSEIVHRIVDELWLAVRPVFLRMRADAVNPAGFWVH